MFRSNAGSNDRSSERNLIYTALTLRVKPFGESNREAWFLTAEEGLIRAAVFGGAKSRLRAQVAPFHGGKLWVYHDPVRDSRKVSDFDVFSYKMGLRGLWERLMAASVVAETILFSQGGGGNWPEALKLAESVLDSLDSADELTCSRITIYFLWHWARLLGAGPEIGLSCACEAKTNGVLWYSVRKEAFFCEKCIQNQGESGFSYPVGPGAAAWLQKIDSLSPEDLTRVTLDAPSLIQAKALSQAVMAEALGRRLPTWNEI